MSLYDKLLAMQIAVDAVIKDGKNQSDKYDFASDENVLDRFRPLMDENKLLLIPMVTAAHVSEGTTRSGTSRYFTELTLSMVWRDVETGEELPIPWYAQGVDLAGEKGVGKALTYAEKYFLLKFFHVPTKKDDPDGDERTRTGEKRQIGTQAAKETLYQMQQSVRQMVDELCGGDEEKIKLTFIAFTQAKNRGYDGVDNLEAISDAALPVVYAKVKKKYEERTGHSFTLKEDADNAAD